MCERHWVEWLRAGLWIGAPYPTVAPWHPRELSKFGSGISNVEADSLMGGLFLVNGCPANLITAAYAFRLARKSGRVLMRPHHRLGATRYPATSASGRLRGTAELKGFILGALGTVTE